jgi:5-hydroxyisourate hydrolase-like protein (transthyretin family)
LPRDVAFGLLAACLVGAAGCGGKTESAKCQPFDGAVVFRGQGVPEAIVRFVPDAEAGNASEFVAEGTTDRNGRFVLKTNNEDGVPAGHYRVTITPYQADLVPAWYTNSAETPLKFEVKEGGHQGVTLTLTDMPPS